MTVEALKSLAEYSQFVAEQLSVVGVVSSTISVWSASPYTGIAEGDVLFSNGLRLRLREELDFEAGLITSYGYEVYNVEERLYWYDDFPHPDEPSLAATHPHHKHVPPDIKHNRIPAPEMSFIRPNLPALIREIEGLISLPESS